MYRVIAAIGAALALAACASNSESVKSGYFSPVLETVRFESEPPGAEAKTSTGQACRTPCALALPGDKPFDVTFTLAGYQPAVEKVEKFAIGDGTTKLRPNPVLAELTPAAPAKKVKKKRRVTHHKRKAAVKRPAKPAAAKPVAPTPAAPTPAAQPQTAPAPAASPWPATPPAR